MTLGSVAEWVTLVVAVCAAAGLIFQLRQSNLARKHEYEDIFVQRYWQLMSGLTAEERISLAKGEMPSSARSDPRTRSLLWSYLELCEDEADQRESGLITNIAWRQWKHGIHGAATRPPYAQILSGFEGELVDLPDAARPFAQLRRAAQVGLHDFDPRRKRAMDWFTG